MTYYFKSTCTQMGPGHHIVHYHSTGQISAHRRILYLLFYALIPLPLFFWIMAVHISVVLMLLCNQSLRY